MVLPGQAPKEVEVNGIRLQYIEQGSGEPIVFLHGAPHDLRAWEPVREEIAKRYRFIAYTQRYFGTEPWPDEGKNYSIATHADDLAKFITSLNAGPVHLIGWSHGGVVALTAAISDPSLVRSLILYEAGVVSVLPAESPEGKIAREDLTRMFGSVVAAASETGDFIKAAKLLQEVVFQLRPGEFNSLPEDLQTVLLDNARVVPLMFAAPRPPVITCDILKDFTRPTLVMQGEKSRAFFTLTTAAPPAITRTVIAATKLPTVTDVPVHFKAVSITLQPDERGTVSAANGILYQMSGSAEVALDGEAKMLYAGEGLFIAGGKTAALTAGSGGPSTFLHFFLAPAANLDRAVETPPAVTRELYRTASPIPDLKPGSYDLNLTRVTFPAQMPSNPPHHRSGAALYFIISGTGANTVDGKTEARGPGSLIYEPYGLVHQWGNRGNEPLIFLAFNINPEGVAAVLPGAPAKNQ